MTTLETSDNRILLHQKLRWGLGNSILSGRKCHFKDDFSGNVINLEGGSISVLSDTFSVRKKSQSSEIQVQCSTYWKESLMQLFLPITLFPMFSLLSFIFYRIVKMSSPNLNVVSLLGSGLTYSSVYLFGIEKQNPLSRPSLEMLIQVGECTFWEQSWDLLCIDLSDEVTQQITDIQRNMWKWIRFYFSIFSFQKQPLQSTLNIF